MSTERFKDNMPGKKPKVYCGQCKWYNSSSGEPGGEECTHPTNVDREQIGVGVVAEWRAWHPRVQNATYDCTLFKPKPKQGFLSRLGKVILELWRGEGGK